MAKPLRWITLLALLLGGTLAPAGMAAPAAPQAVTYYVDAATGSDLDDCLTPATACATLAEATERAVDGDSVIIGAGVYLEQLDVYEDLIISGAGAENTFIDGGGVQRAAQVGFAIVSISDLTIRNGYVSGQVGGGLTNQGTLILENVILTGNETTLNGGGIFNNGALTMLDSQVISNTAVTSGGGIYNSSSGVLTVLDSLIAGNESGGGGGVHNISQAIIQDSTIRDNYASLFGGGVANWGGTLTLERVTVSGNRADYYAGGIEQGSGTLNLTNVTISGNQAPNYVALFSANSGTTANLLNTTVSANLVTAAGNRTGGIVVFDSAQLEIKNSIVAGNDGRQCSSSATLTSLGHNLASDTTCGFTASGDQQNTEAELAELGNYGGATLTHALLPGSPAIDGANNSGCPATDQRGAARPFDGDGAGGALCDIGAVEARNQLTIEDVSLLEGDSGVQNMVFTLSVYPTSSSQVTVNYATLAGSATAGSDYTAVSGQAVILANQPSTTLNVPVLGDNDDEFDETFSVVLTNPVGADLLDGIAVGTIIDDDGLGALTIADAALNEGDSGTQNMVFTVNLSPAADGAVSVEYTTADLTASAGNDYTLTSGVINFTTGQSSQVISVPIIGDLVDEGAAETFEVLLSNPVNALVMDASATGTITDDDLAQVSLTSGTDVSEGDAGVTLMTFTVSLTRPAAFAVTVSYASNAVNSDGSATAGVDFVSTSGGVTFAPFETQKTFSVQIIGDRLYEVDESVSVSIFDANPVSIYGSGGSAYILNDDQPTIYLPLMTRP